MNYKFAVPIVALLAVPVFASALVTCRDTVAGCTLDQNLQLVGQASVFSKEELLDILKNTVVQLTAKLSQQPTISASTGRGCIDLNNSLILGSTDATTNGEVSKLQRFIGAYKVNKLYTIAPSNQSGASAEDLQPVTGYYGTKTAVNVMEWQKAHGMDFVTLTSGVGPMTREKMKCSNVSAVAKINWTIVSANPALTDENDYRKYEQSISVDVTRADRSTQRYNVDKAYGCAQYDTTESALNGKKVLGQVHCYMAATGVNFTAYIQNEKFIVERQDEDASGRTSGKTSVVLEL